MASSVGYPKHPICTIEKRVQAPASLREAWQWEMPYAYAEELSASVASKVTASAQSALCAVRDAVAQRGTWRFSWGEAQATWRRVLVDAEVMQLTEE